MIYLNRNAVCHDSQKLLAGAKRELVCKALIVTDRVLRKWINFFNLAGVDGLIVKRQLGRTVIISASDAPKLAALVDQPEKAGRAFWTEKAFHGYISEIYQIDCSCETVVRFFYRKSFALKVPQPWINHQNEVLREQFLQKLEKMWRDQHIHIWFEDESGFEGDPHPRRRWD